MKTKPTATHVKTTTATKQADAFVNTTFCRQRANMGHRTTAVHQKNETKLDADAPLQA